MICKKCGLLRVGYACNNCAKIRVSEWRKKNPERSKLISIRSYNKYKKDNKLTLYKEIDSIIGESNRIKLVDSGYSFRRCFVTRKHR